MTDGAKFMLGAIIVPLVALGFFFVIGLAILWEAYVLTILWGWFVTPTFGLAVPSLLMMAGLALVVGQLTTQYVPSKKDDHWMWASIFIKPTFVLLMGWVVKQYI